MTRDLDPGDLPEPPEPPEPHGTLAPTRPGVLVGLGLAAFVLGWLARPAAVAWLGAAPTVGWMPVLALVLVAAILGGVAVTTYRALQTRREWIEPYRAVNRLVLAKSCALAGAVVAGGYLGYALSWVGLDAELGGQRILRAGLAGLAGVAIVAASLLLERACRVRDGGDTDLP